MSTLRLSIVGLTSRLVATGLTVVTTLLLARYLGPEPTGQYFLFLRVVALIAVFADLGFSQSTNVFTGRGEQPGQVHGIIVRFSAAASIVLAAAFLVAMALFGPKILPNYPRPLQIATAISIPLFVYSQLWNFFMIGLGRIWTMNAVQVASATISLVGVSVLVIGMAQGLNAAVGIYVGVLVVQVFVMAFVAWRVARTAGGTPRPGVFGDMWQFGLRGYSGSVSAVLWQRIPVFALNVFSGPAAVGVFSVGQQLVEKMLLPIQATQEAIYRRMAQANPEDARAAMNRYIRVSAWAMLLFFAAAALVLPIAVSLVLGPKYRAAVPVILVLVPAALMMAVSLLLATFFLAHLGRPGLLSILAMSNVALIAVFSFVLIPRFGTMGAAFAVGATQIIGTVVVIILYLRFTGGRLAELVRISGDDREVFLRQLRLAMNLRSQEP